MINNNVLTELRDALTPQNIVSYIPGELASDAEKMDKLILKLTELASVQESQKDTVLHAIRKDVFPGFTDDELSDFKRGVCTETLGALITMIQNIKITKQAFQEEIYEVAGQVADAVQFVTICEQSNNLFAILDEVAEGLSVEKEVRKEGELNSILSAIYEKINALIHKKEVDEVFNELFFREHSVPILVQIQEVNSILEETWDEEQRSFFYKTFQERYDTSWSNFSARVDSELSKNKDIQELYKEGSECLEFAADTVQEYLVDYKNTLGKKYQNPEEDLLSYRSKLEGIDAQMMEQGIETGFAVKLEQLKEIASALYAALEENDKLEKLAYTNMEDSDSKEGAGKGSKKTISFEKNISKYGEAMEAYDHLMNQMRNWLKNPEMKRTSQNEKGQKLPKLISGPLARFQKKYTQAEYPVLHKSINLLLEAIEKVYSLSEEKKLLEEMSDDEDEFLDFGIKLMYKNLMNL